MKPKLAAFPKCYIDDLCVHQTMTLFDWIEMASTLGVDGLEFYSGFLKDEPAFLEGVKDRLQKHGLQMPMLTSLLPFAETNGVILTLENHYKDSFWRYPEFAQKMDVFLEIVEQIDSPWFGVNFDPSNTVFTHGSQSKMACTEWTNFADRCGF